MSDERSQKRRKRRVPSRWRHLARGALATSAATAALLPAPAGADPGISFGGGIFIGYHFGEGPHLAWGVEGFGTYLENYSGCNTDERSGAGAFARVAWQGGLERTQLTLGAHAGGELERAAMALGGELGATYRFGAGGGLGLHTGVMAELPALLINTTGRYEWFLNEGFLGAGARLLPTYGAPFLCSVGRPLRSDAGLFALHSAPRMLEAARGRQAPAGAAAIAAVGLAFERDAQLECASVPAFLQLAHELDQLGGPRSLVARALSAARDEVRHTALCAGLAERHLGACAAPAAPDCVPRAVPEAEAGIERLAVESWLDGCIAEGRAAAHAARAATLCTDAHAQRVQHTIAGDELRHAELAWSILGWARTRGGERVHEAVRAVRDLGGGAIAHEPAAQGLAAHGRLDTAELDRVAARHFERSRRRLDALLATL